MDATETDDALRRGLAPRRRASRFVGAMAVMGTFAGGASAGAVPLPTAPASCSNWVAHGPQRLDQSNGLKVQAGWNGQSVDPAPDSVLLLLADGTAAQVDDKGHPVQHGSHGMFGDYHSNQTGTASGGIHGTSVDFTVNWDSVKPPVSNHYVGTIDPTGHVTGSDTNSAGAASQWHFESALQCG